jgi:hypothetical protein
MPPSFPPEEPVTPLDAGLALRRGGTPSVHGFQLAKAIADRADAAPAVVLSTMGGAALLAVLAVAGHRHRRRIS